MLERFRYFITDPNNRLKLIFGLIGLLILGEIIWAAYSLTRPLQKKAGSSTSLQNNSKPATLATPPSQASIALTGPQTGTVGDSINVSIQISATEPTDGTDLIIKYDPALLQLQPAKSGAKNVAVVTGLIYQDYPINTHDPQTGVITISGVTNPSSKGFLGEGSLGKISFKLLKPGKASLSLDFTNGSTADSNVISTSSGKDILNKVQNLEIVIK